MEEEDTGRKEGRGRGITWRSGSALKKYWGVVEGVGEERRVVLLRSEANWGGRGRAQKQGCGASQSVSTCSLVFFNPGRARVLDVAQHQIREGAVERKETGLCD